MIKLVEFTSAHNWEEKVVINPEDVSFINRFQLDRDMGEYSKIVFCNGRSVDVSGLPTVVAKKIRDSQNE